MTVPGPDILRLLPTTRVVTAPGPDILRLLPQYKRRQSETRKKTDVDEMIRQDQARSDHARPYQGMLYGCLYFLYNYFPECPAFPELLCSVCLRDNSHYSRTPVLPCSRAPVLTPPNTFPSAKQLSPFLKC